jgi:SecD/SecF fusion protein
MKLDVVKSKMPSNVKLLLEADKADTRNNPNALVSIFAIKTVPGSSKAKLEGDKVTDAKMDYDMNNRPSISMTMNSSGARIWSKMTGDNKGRFIAIVLDDKVYSAPRVNDQIDGGRSSITGSFSVQEATDLANILKSGKLPAPAKIVQEQVVGPTLGAESIKGGSISLILSFVIIFTLMIVYYNTGGMVANIALILNLLLTAGFLATLGATLTMPGIAGLVLTIGMAVDTNVLVFERIKEELKKGKTYQQAVDDGYFRSYAPVLDGHITSLITAIILFIFGLGPVLGFATTQIIGLLLSMFCGLVVSRMITDIYMKRGKHFNYFTKITENMFKNVNFDFVGKRKIAYIISAIVLVLGIASFFNGFDQGVEFAGGRSYTVSLKDKTKITDVRSKLAPHFDGEFPVVKTIGTGNDVNITTSYLIEKPDANTSDEVRAKLHEALVKEGLIDASISQEAFAKTVIKEEKTVLPTISDDLKAGAVKATIYSLIAIFIYILARFRKWQFSMGTIIALLHDVLITIIVFSFLRNVVPFGLEIDQHFIAAILTVIGFSMNDTVVVFDRIRENFRLHPNETKAQIINRSINETLSRTVLTSLSVFLTILVLFIFGGEVLRGFSFAMLVGVLTGVYSTIFVAAPFLLDMDKTNTLKDEVDREAYIKKLKEEA